MKWILVAVLINGAGGGKLNEIGQFKSEGACKAATALLKTKVFVDDNGFTLSCVRHDPTNYISTRSLSGRVHN